MSRAPRRLLLNDEGSSALHYLDLDAPRRSWTAEGEGRDLQLIGAGRVLRSTPTGYVEIDLASGKRVGEVSLSGTPGIESARRLPNGHTLLLGNGERGIFVWEVDAKGRLRTDRELVAAGLRKGRLLRRTAHGSLLFCSETDGERVVHEATWEDGVSVLFRIPADVPADSMVKAVHVTRDHVVISTGYAASLLLIDTSRGAIVRSIGGKAQVAPKDLRRPLSPHFFSGFQWLPGRGYLVANWQGHGPSHAGDGYQVLMYDSEGQLCWTFDQSKFAGMTSLNNVIALDDLDTSRLHDELNGALVPVV
jgi:hypothetical protein